MTRHSNLILMVLATVLPWFTCNLNGADTPSSTQTKTWTGEIVPDGVVWKGSEIGLAIGIKLAEDAKVGATPVIDVYLRNEGRDGITGVVQGRNRFIVELNGKYYASRDIGGKESYMESGMILGPLRVDAARFWEIPKLVAVYVNSPNESHPGFVKGKNTLRLHYKVFGDKTQILVSSAELVIHT